MLTMWKSLITTNPDERDMCLSQIIFLQKNKKMICKTLKEMNMANEMRAIHPGEILKGELEELNLSANAFAKVLGVPTNRITAILNEQRSVTADTALRLARYFGSTPDFWMSLQSNYDVKVAWEAVGNDIEKSVKPRESLEA